MELGLSNNDLRWAHWRNIPHEKCPKSVPFNLEACLDKIRTLKSGNRSSAWGKAKINIGISPQEAHFWLETFAKSGEKWTLSPKELFNYLNKPEKDFDGNVSLSDVNQYLSNVVYYSLTPEVIVPLYRLLSPSDFVQAWNSLDNINTYYQGSTFETFRLKILPYLTPDQKDVLRSSIRPLLSAGSNDLIALAGLLGGFDAQLEQYLNLNKNYHTHQHQRYYATFGLNDPEKVQHYIRKKNLTFYTQVFMTAWVAHTELTALDWVSHSVNQGYNKAQKKSAFTIFKKLPFVEAVPHVLKLWEEPQLVADALEWLTQHPEIVAQSLTPIALSKDSQAKLAQKYLRRMVSMGQAEALEAMLPTLEAGDQERFQTEILAFYENDIPEFDATNTPQWLTEAIAHQAKIKIKPPAIQWIDVLSLPPLTVNGFRLNSDQIQQIIIALCGNNDLLIDGIKQHISQLERDDFIWALYQSWEDAGTPAKGKWVFDSLGLLGGDTVVLKLIPLIKKWPGESKAKRATDGIKILQQIGTDTALMQINNLTQKIRYKSIKESARTAMENIAKARGLSQLELEDRIIPDCGLDEHGTREFDFGARQFTFVLSSEMKPMIRDDKDKLNPNLPKPNKKDDEGLAAQAIADWKLIKKQVREVAKLQVARLEQAMISQHRWAINNFTEFYIKHPLMIHIVRLLLWNTYDEHGKLIQTLRINEDRHFVDVDDEPVDLASISQIGVLHVIELDEATRQEWGDVLSDYEIIAPFQQLSRKVSTLEDDEIDQKTITRFEPFKVEPVVLVSILEKSGWLRGRAQDGGIYYSHAKYYPANNITAFVRYYGIPMGYWDFNKQGIDECFFVAGEQQPEGYDRTKQESMMRLGDVPPVIMSETLRILHAIAGKAE